MRQSKIIYKIHITKECIGCAECVDLCPTHVLTMKANYAHVESITQCISCFVCKKTCSIGAIKIVTKQ